MPANAENVDTEILREIERRLLWLAVRMVDSANHDRGPNGGVKVGGHQASSASMVSIMTALWFAHLGPHDRVSVKPHASPVFHAIQYLLGNLDRSYLTRLRELGGLQAYPSRTKDPDPIDFSTGSVGLGAVAPLFAALTRRYVDVHFGARPSSRFYAILGDAELDEGNVWEAVFEPATRGLGNVTWVVDLNRQSLDRVVPGIRARQWQERFASAGWNVIELKYGSRLRAAFQTDGGCHLRSWLDALGNEQYQSLYLLHGQEFRDRLLQGAPPDMLAYARDRSSAELKVLVEDLGGHDLGSLTSAFVAADRVQDRPSVIFAFTIKGWGLPIAGHPRNHSALLTPAEIDDLRDRSGVTRATEWDPVPEASPAGRWIAARRRVLQRPAPATGDAVRVPTATGLRTAKPLSTQEAFGRVLQALARDPQVAPLLVTTAPDVATSTNLAGFINRCGVFAPTEADSWDDDAGLRWREGPSGQHIELGISEMNLFSLLGQLGLAWDLCEHTLIPVGTVYDPFVLRGLDALIYGVYSGARFIFAGTPSGMTLAPEGGAHQSTITPSVGLELPGLTSFEPAYAQALDWLMCDAAGRVSRRPDARSVEPSEHAAYYFRLSTRPLDQSPFAHAEQRIGTARLRELVLAGGYRLIDSAPMGQGGAPAVSIVASGSVLPESLAAAAELCSEGIAADVVDVTSLSRLYAAWHHQTRSGIRTARPLRTPAILRELFPERNPVVTVHDGASHAMAWLGGALGTPCVSLGVDEFGQSGSVADLYRTHDLDAGSIVNAALAALSLQPANEQSR